MLSNTCAVGSNAIKTCMNQKLASLGKHSDDVRNVHEILMSRTAVVLVIQITTAMFLADRISCLSWLIRI